MIEAATKALVVSVVIFSFIQNTRPRACGGSSSSETEELPPNEGGGSVPDDTSELPPNDSVIPGLTVTGLENDPTGVFTSPWLVNMFLFRNTAFNPLTGDAFVELLQYENDFPVSTHVDFYTPALDTCFIRDLTSGDGGNPDDTNFPFHVSGGSTITINTASGPWTNIFSSNPGIYEVNDGLPGVLPTDATLSIPGDQFPNVPAYPLAVPSDVPVRIAPLPGFLTAADLAAPFTWEARPDVPGGYFQIVGIAFDLQKNFVGFPVVCTLVDDGEFTMPTDVVEAFTDSSLNVSARFERVLDRVDYIDGIVFHQRSVLTE